MRESKQHIFFIIVLSILLGLIIINLIYLKINMNLYNEAKKNYTASISPTFIENKESKANLENSIRFEEHKTQNKDTQDKKQK